MMRYFANFAKTGNPNSDVEIDASGDGEDANHEESNNSTVSSYSGGGGGPSSDLSAATTNGLGASLPPWPQAHEGSMILDRDLMKVDLNGPRSSAMQLWEDILDGVQW